MRVLDFDHALQLRIHVSLDDLLAEEFQGLKVLQYERNLKQQEDMERERTDREMKQRRASGNTVFQNKGNQG